MDRLANLNKKLSQALLNVILKLLSVKTYPVIPNGQRKRASVMWTPFLFVGEKKSCTSNPYPFSYWN